MRKVVCNIVFLFGLGVAHAQAPDNFFLTFGGSGEDAAYACKQTIEGDYIVMWEGDSIAIFNRGRVCIALFVIYGRFSVGKSCWY